MGERLGRLGSFIRANGIALAALFIALGGTATAVQRNSVGTPELKNNAVKPKKIARNAVRTPKIAGGAVKTPKMEDGAVTSAKLRDGAVTSAKVANDSITAPKIATNSVTGPKLAPGSVGTAALAPGVLGAAEEVVTVPRRQINAPVGTGTTETVLFQRAPFTLTGRCSRGSGTSSAAVYIESTEAAMSLPIGNPPTTANVTPGAPRLVAPSVSSQNVGVATRRGSAAVWAITAGGRYLNLSTFVARETVGTAIVCTFGVAGFANRG